MQGGHLYEFKDVELKPEDCDCSPRFIDFAHCKQSQIPPGLAVFYNDRRDGEQQERDHGREVAKL